MRRENQRNILPHVGRQRLDRRPGLLGERLDEPRMVEEMPQLVDPGGARANLCARRCDVIEILPAAGVGAVGRGHESDGAHFPYEGRIEADLLHAIHDRVRGSGNFRPLCGRQVHHNNVACLAFVDERKNDRTSREPAVPINLAVDLD